MLEDPKQVSSDILKRQKSSELSPPELRLQNHLLMATGLEEVSFYSDPKEGQCQRMFKLLYNCTHFMLKILQARLQQYVN